MLRRLLSSCLVLGLGLACGGSVAEVDSTRPVDAGGSGSTLHGGAVAHGGSLAGGDVGVGGSGFGGHPTTQGGSAHGGHPGQGGHGQQAGNPGFGGNGGDGGLGEFHDPGCPDPGPPTEAYDCDPYGSPDQCGDGSDCQPFVQYPDSPCDKEIYGATCEFTGTGQQGDPCDEGCAAHHICVVTGEGTQCVELCDLNQAEPCPDGLICSSVDIPGVGGCI